MSTTKKIVSILLVLVLVLGVGFGAYFIFGKKGKISEEKAISLVSETSKKLNTAITTMGNGVSGNTTTGTLSGSLNANATASLNGGSNDMSDYVYFLNSLTFANAYLEMVNYGLNLGDDNAIKFDKTYSGFSGSALYITVYRTSDSVVFELGAKSDGEEEGVRYSMVANTYGVVDYDKENDKASSFNFFVVQEENSTSEGVTTYDLELRIYSMDFEQKMFNCYEVYMYDINSASVVKDFRNKLSKGTLKFDDIKDYINFDIGGGYFYSGNIADNVDDIKLSTHKEVNTRKQLFDSYSSNVKHLDVIASSKLNYDKATNLSTVGSNIMSYFVASQDKYLFGVNGNNFYYVEFPDWKTVDSVIIEILKTNLNSMSYSNANGTVYNDEIQVTLDSEEEFTLLNNTINALEEYYNRHKDDKNYVPLILGVCNEGLDLVSSTSKLICNSGFYKAGTGVFPDDSFIINLYCGSLADATSYPIEVVLYLGTGE